MTRCDGSLRGERGEILQPVRSGSMDVDGGSPRLTPCRAVVQRVDDVARCWR